MKNYYQSPLPFQGQKRFFLKIFKKEISKYSDKYVFIDLFGGSGLLSHTVKSIFPNAKVVYNDFDNFKERLNNIENTNFILNELRTLLQNCPRDKKITQEKRTQVLNVLKKHNEAGFVDWITLSASLLFGGNYALPFEEFKKSTLYNVVRKSNYSLSLDYLQDVEIVSMDYRNLFNKYKDTKEVVFITDPPYLNTNIKTYNKANYWGIKDYLNVLDVLKGQSYFYFTSNKSQIVELCEWLGFQDLTTNPFFNAIKFSTSVGTSHNSDYTDIMYHCKKQ